MELIKNLRYMCRICAVNIKKRRSSSSAVSILETTQLTEKLKKYLNIDINYNDVLPKSICSVCYKKVEAIHALSALAKKTENFLTDFIKIAQNNLKQHVPLENFQSIYNNQNDEFNQFSLLDNNNDCNIIDNDIICCEDDEQRGGGGGGNSEQEEEVVLNFTLNDPLTKNTHKKIVVAKQKKQQQQHQHQHQQNLILNQRQQHKKYQHDLSQFSTSITPTITSSTPTQSQQYNKNYSDTATTNNLIREIQEFNKRNNNELINNTSLEQKRQNLKMILNNTTNNSSIQQQQQKSPESSSTTNNYNLIIPNSGNNNNSGSNICNVTTSPNINQNSGGHSINVAVQIQQQPPPPIYSTTNQQQSELLQQQSELLQQQQQQQNILLNTNNNRTAQMINDCLNLGSVIKDMDLLKLILKALKWPFNQDTLNIQISRLKNTRFRDVMIDPNLLQDTDLMQILSSYLSPILLQTSPTSQTTNLSLSTSANILPPSVSYKIPAETSVRLVCVPRDEQQHHQQQNEQQHQQHLEELEKYQQLSSQTTISSLQSNKKYNNSYNNYDYKTYNNYKSKKKHLKKYQKKSLSEKNYHRRLQQQQQHEPIIILSDDESHSSDNIQKFEVNVDPMLYFNGADSSYENSNESTMITMGYFKQHHQQQQSQGVITALNSEVTLQQQQKRKKQKRKQTLIQNPINKNILDQEILIIDENGEKPIQLNNELLCIPSKNNNNKKYNNNDNNKPSTSSKNYNIDNDYLINIPSTSTSILSNNDKSNKETNNFEFTTPKKKRKLNTLKSSTKEIDIFTVLPKVSKNKVPRSDSMVIIHKPELTKIENKLQLHKEIKLEKSLNDVSIIAVNKSYESTKKFVAETATTNNKPIVELMPKKSNINDNKSLLKNVEENIAQKLDKNIVDNINKDVQQQTINLENLKESHIIDKIIDKFEEKIVDIKQNEKNKELPTEIIEKEEDNVKIDCSSGGVGADDDADSVDTNNGELVIDEGYDEEKLKDDDNKNDKDTPLELKSIVEETESKLLSTTEEGLVSGDSIISKTKAINDSIENNTLRRSRRQTKFKTPIMKSNRKTTNTIKKNLVTAGTVTAANVKNTVVSTRGKTRQQEQKTKMQTRNSNISQRGREQKPFTKYAKKKS